MNSVKLIPLNTFTDRRGAVSVLEDIPFKVNRIFTIYNVPSSTMRGGHAHKKCHQLLIATCGSVLVKVGGKTYVLDCPTSALYIPPKYRVDIMFMNEDSVLVVLASEKFDKDDYIHGTN